MFYSCFYIREDSTKVLKSRSRKKSCLTFSTGNGECQADNQTMERNANEYNIVPFFFSVKLFRVSNKIHIKFVLGNKEHIKERKLNPRFHLDSSYGSIAVYRNAYAP